MRKTTNDLATFQKHLLIKNLLQKMMRFSLRRCQCKCSGYECLIISNLRRTNQALPSKWTRRKYSSFMEENHHFEVCRIHPWSMARVIGKLLLSTLLSLKIDPFVESEEAQYHFWNDKRATSSSLANEFPSLLPCPLLRFVTCHMWSDLLELFFPLTLKRG